MEIPKKRELTEGELNYNKDLTEGVETNDQLRELAAEIRRKATSIYPPEIDLITDEKLKNAIKNSFLKVGTDVGKLAGIIEKMLGNKI